MTTTATSERSLLQDCLAVGPASTLRREIMIDLFSILLVAIVFYVVQPSAVLVGIVAGAFAVYIAIRFAIGFTRTWKSA